MPHVDPIVFAVLVPTITAAIRARLRHTDGSNLLVGWSVLVVAAAVAAAVCIAAIVLPPELAELGAAWCVAVGAPALVVDLMRSGRLHPDDVALLEHMLASSSSSRISRSSSPSPPPVSTKGILS